MTRTPVIRDTTHPDFPHGEPRGSTRGCKEECCKGARRRQMKQAKVRRQRGIYVRSVPPNVVKRVMAHIDYLHEECPGSIEQSIVRAAGIDDQVIYSMRHRGRSMSYATARAILAVTPEQVDANRILVPTEQVQWYARTLQAIGYPLNWQSEQVGHNVVHFASKRRIHDDGTGRSIGVHVHIAQAIMDLHTRLADTPADTARDGIPKPEIARAKGIARKHGYYPPACYDEGRNLDHRAVPGHPWAIADDLAHDKVTQLRIITARNHDEQQHRLARALGLHSDVEIPTKTNGGRENDPDGFTAAETLKQACRRLRDTLGLTYSDPQHKAVAARWRDELAVFDHSGEEALAFCLRTGLVKTGRKGIAADHPAVVEYLEQADERAA